MDNTTIPDLAAWCRREAENLVLLEARYLMASPGSGSTSYTRDAARLRAIASALERAERLEAAAANNAALRHALTLALEYWSHRQQRYKNRHPAWVVAARAALTQPAKETDR